MLIKLIKKVVPTFLKDFIKISFDFGWWVLNYRKVPFIVKNSFKINQIVYPWDKAYISLVAETHGHQKEFTAIKKLIKPGDIVFDVGANTGITSTYFSKLSGTHGKVYAFEPVLETFELMKENVAINRLNNVSCQQLAISDIIGQTEMHLFDITGHSLSSLGKVTIGNKTTDHTTRVDVTTLDEFCIQQSISHIDFLKIDVEGFEENVFKGAKKLLSQGNVKYIQFEVSLMPLVSVGKSVTTLFEIIKSYGYICYRYNESLDIFEGPINKEDGGFDNYYASREDLTKL